MCDICSEEIKDNWNARSIDKTIKFTDKRTQKIRSLEFSIRLLNIIKPDLCEGCFRERAIKVATEGFISKY
jgi:hypothetical protein